IVRLHERVLVLGVAMHTQAHSDRSVNDLSGDPVLVHVWQPRSTPISALADVRKLEPLGTLVSFLDAETGAINEAERYGTLHSRHHEGLGAVRLRKDPGRVVAILRVDIVDIAIGGFAHMAIRRNDTARNHVKFSFRRVQVRSAPGGDDRNVATPSVPNDRLFSKCRLTPPSPGAVRLGDSIGSCRMMSRPWRSESSGS